MPEDASEIVHLYLESEVSGMWRYSDIQNEEALELRSVSVTVFDHGRSFLYLQKALLHRWKLKDELTENPSSETAAVEDCYEPRIRLET